MKQWPYIDVVESLATVTDCKEQKVRHVTQILTNDSVKEPCCPKLTLKVDLCD